MEKLLDKLRSGAPLHEVEKAAHAVGPCLSRQERRQLNDALLCMLAEEKRCHPAPAAGSYRDLLADPSINALVNALVIVNEGLIRRMVRRIKVSCSLKEPVEELFSKALIGRDGEDADVQGVIGAILHYNYERYGADSFSTYLPRAIANAFRPSAKQKRNHEGIDGRLVQSDDWSWVGRIAAPEERALNRELIDVLRGSMRHLPAARREVLDFFLGRLLRTGERPTFQEIGDAFGYSATRAEQVVKDAVERVREHIARDYPQLAASGVNGWEGIVATFERRRPDVLPATDRARR